MKSTNTEKQLRNLLRIWIHFQMIIITIAELRTIIEVDVH